MRRRKITLKLTPVEVNHILGLLLDNEIDGGYYGPRAQYWKRHERICRAIREGLNEEGE